MTTTPKPSAIFATIARQMPASSPDKAVSPKITGNTVANTCSVCGEPLKPGRVHVVGGFECRAAQGQL
jgi:hypothetical protein